ncbi:MAG: ABC transporter substrate-binding protein [Nitrososphaerota archaeon]
MNKKVSSLLILCFLMIISTTLAFPINAQEEQKFEPYGPRVDFVVCKIYTNELAESFALRAGEIDLMDWPVAPDLVPEFKEDPNIKLYPYEEFGMFQIDINHRRWPTSDVNFRRALAHLVNKEKLVSEIVKGFGKVMDSPVTDVWGAFYNPNVPKYEYNPVKAAEILDKAGFVKGPDGWRIDPKTGKKLDPIVFYVRVDHIPRKTAGEWLAAEMQKIGIPVDLHVVERAICSKKVFEEYDFHLYTGGWSLGRDPTHLYDLYHSSMDVYPEPDSLNYPGFRNAEFDKAAEKVKWGETFEEVKEGAWEAQRIFMDQVATIPLYQSAAVVGASAKWEGWVNMKGFGIGSSTGAFWSLLNAHPKDLPFGGTLRFGFKSDPEDLNPVKAEWLWDWLVLQEIYESVPFAVHPYTLEDLPWTATWKTEPWEYKPGEKGIKITFKLAENMTFHDGKPVTAEDVKFTYDFLMKYQPPYWLTAIERLVKVEAPDKYTVILYCNASSYLMLHIVSVPILPKHIWEKVGENWYTYDPVAEGTLIGSGPFQFVEYKPGEHVLLKAFKDYFRRHPDKKISAKAVSIPSTIAAGQKPSVTIQAIDYSGKPITGDAKVTLSVAGQTVEMKHIGGGVWEATLPALTEGSYTLEFNVVWKSPIGDYSTKLTSPLTVSAIVPITTTTLPTVAPITAPAPSAGMDIALGIIVFTIVLLAIGFVISRLKVSSAPAAPKPS